MSNILKFIVMVVAWGVLFLGSYYGCIKPEYCPDDTQVAVDPPPVETPADDYSVVTSYGSNELLTGKLWEPDLQGYYDKFMTDKNQAVEITGMYYDGEAALAAVDDLGMYRATAIKELLVAKGIPAANIRTFSRQQPGERPADGELFPAGSLAWGTMVSEQEPDKTEIVQVADGKFSIRFPFSKKIVTLDNEAEEYLQTLATRVKQTKESITITGHTDNVSSEAFNMALGQDRADFIRDRLVSYGVDAGLITTSSQGENSPKTSNASAEGRRINRRAVIVLNKTQ